MKTKQLLVLAILVLSACRKTDSNAIISAGVSNNLAAATDTVKVPITDLGSKTFRGYVGGLYPGGLNRPTGDYKRDLTKFYKKVAPLNAQGLIDSSNGKIVWISLGGSTGGHTFRELKDKTLGNPLTNPYLVLQSASDGSGEGSQNSIMNPSDPYWTHVNQVLARAFLTPKQVQIIYYETEDSIPLVSFPGRPNLFKNDMEVAMRTIKAKFINCKLVYVQGRTTTFPPVTRITNVEPCPYYNGWGEKFMIEDQINGVAGTEYKGAGAVAPLVTWGWYQWADGSNVPRKDGFTWQSFETTDGMHPTDAGLDTLATRMQNFFLADQYASIWYANHTAPRVAP
jgi:hypothetical protein